MKTPTQMKNGLVVLFVFGLSALLQSCGDSCEHTVTYTYYEPVYTSLETFRTAVELEAPIDISVPGRIYFKNNYLYINETGKGIHVIDNKDPENPNKVGFVNIPGNFDLAAKGNFLYADSYIDMVILDISNPNEITEVARMEDVFPHHNQWGTFVDAELGLITEWIETEAVEVLGTDCDEVQPEIIFLSDALAIRNETASFASAPSNNPGVGGSLAKFTISGDHLYTIDDHQLQVLDISSLGNPVVGEKVHIGWGIETIFPYRQNLFIGAQNGMHILSLENPDLPNLLSTYEHVNSCDPVVVENDIAYVTLRSGSGCQGFTNQLEVIDIADLREPKLLKIYPMENPWGLGIDNDILFICDGPAGLKIFNAKDKLSIDDHLLAQYESVRGIDVIPSNNVLMLIAEDGLYQYDYGDVEAIRQLSFLPIIPQNQ